MKTCKPCILKTSFLPKPRRGINRLFYALLLIIIVVSSSGCLPEPSSSAGSSSWLEELNATPTTEPTPLPEFTPQPTRPVFQPGELVDYTAQSGDTLPALAVRFNTTVEEIRAANPIIPDSATTMPPGMPMQIPIYYRPLWGTSYQIIPDSLFVNGPAQRDFDAVAFVDQQPGWLKNYVDYVGGDSRRGGEVINYVATTYSVSPRLLLAIAEYMSGALTQPEPPSEDNLHMLGKKDYRKNGFYRQLAWLADTLNSSYYLYRSGDLLSFELKNGRLEYPDPWQNAATVALQHYFSTVMSAEDYQRAISEVGLALTYRNLFGDPWENEEPHIPGSLVQPEMYLPFEPGKVWAYTGGPHSAWGEYDSPLAAIDFAPPSVVGGCKSSSEWVTAVADGVISRTGTGIAVLDLDGDGDERTGWAVHYLHLETSSIPPVGTQMSRGDRIGHPSCEGGVSTGTHVHMSRKYNGEWILAGDVLAFNLEGWIVQNGSSAYQGMLRRNSQTVIACTCSDKTSHIQSSGQLIFQP